MYLPLGQKKEVFFCFFVWGGGGGEEEGECEGEVFKSTEGLKIFFLSEFCNNIWLCLSLVSSTSQVSSLSLSDIIPSC